MDSVAEVEKYENEDSFFVTLGPKLEGALSRGTRTTESL